MQASAQGSAGEGDPDDEQPVYVSPEMANRLGGTDPDEMDEWTLAVNFAAWRKLLHAHPRKLERMRAKAVGAVLRRAKELLRQHSRPTETHLEEWRAGASGDLDVEETLDRAAGKPHAEPEDLVVAEKREKRADLALALDVSLSMAGENLALLAVSAAVLALRADPRDLAVVAFETHAELLTRRGEAIEPEEIVRKILEVPAGGFTNIEAGLDEARKALKGSRSPRRAVILVSDGKSTEGGDPREVAKRIPRLHVVHIGRDPHGRRLSRSRAATRRCRGRWTGSPGGSSGRRIFRKDRKNHAR